MPNAIKYSTSAQTLALKKGNFWIGTGDVGKGPTSTTDYYNGITPPSGGYTIYLNKASGGPSIYTAANDSQLISLSNTIAGQTFATAAAALAWFATQTDKMVFNADYPAIVTDGLVLNLDAGFTPSYPTTGTTWYDMSSAGNNGTLVNGPAYSSSNSGVIVFDGTNDYSNMGNISYNRTNFSVFIWCTFPSYHTNWVSTINKWYTGGGDGSGNEWSLSPNNSSGPSPWAVIVQYGPGQNSYLLVSDTVNYTTNTWYNAGFTWNSGTLKLYINGVEKASGTTPNTAAQTTTQPFAIANFYNLLTYFNRVNVSSAQLYSKTLSQTEITQNYNAQKGRFGL